MALWYSELRSHLLAAGRDFVGKPEILVGQGLDGLSSLYLNNIFIGVPTDGDNVGARLQLRVWIDVFDLTFIWRCLRATIRLKSARFPNCDGWARLFRS